MLIFCDSFDHYTSLAQKYDVVSNTPTVSATAARTGIAGLIGGTTGNCYVQKIFTSRSTYIWGAAINLQNVTAEECFLMFGDSGTMQDYFTIDSVGTVRARRGGTFGGASSGTGGTLLGTSTANIPLASYHYLEVLLTIDASLGVVTVKLDGVTILTLTSQNTKNSSNTTANQVAFGNCTNNNMTFWFDDVYICDNSGSLNNTFLGNTAIQCVLPTGNGATNQWAIGGGSPAATNWQSVNEHPPDDGTTFVDDGTVGHIDLYTFPAVTGTSISAVVVNLRANEAAAGTRAIRAEAKSSSASADNGTDFSLSTTFADFQGVFETDPNTSAPWATSAVNSANFGAKVTI